MFSGDRRQEEFLGQIGATQATLASARTFLSQVVGLRKDPEAPPAPDPDDKAEHRGRGLCHMFHAYRASS